MSPSTPFLKLAPFHSSFLLNHTPLVAFCALKTDPVNHVSVAVAGLRKALAAMVACERFHVEMRAQVVGSVAHFEKFVLAEDAG